MKRYGGGDSQYWLDQGVDPEAEARAEAEALMLEPATDLGYALEMIEDVRERISEEMPYAGYDESGIWSEALGQIEAQIKTLRQSMRDRINGAG